jgi:hypothetical protein
MKKLYFLALGLLFLNLQASAQVEITFQVDLTNYLAAGNTLQTVKIAGNFGTNGAIGVPDWTPPGGPAFTDLGNNVWSTTITFPATSVGNSLLYKFLNTADSWGACDVDQECIVGGECTDGGNDGNRLLVIPGENTTLCYYFDECNVCGSTNTNETAAGNRVKIVPNPMSSTALVTFPKAMDRAVATLSSATGQLVRSYTFSGTNLEIEKDGLQPGLYFLTIPSEAGRMAALKLVVQ